MPVPLVGLMPVSQLSGVLTVQVLQPISPTGGVYADEKLPPVAVGVTVSGANVPALHTRLSVVPELSVVVTEKLARSDGPLPLTTITNVDGELNGAGGL